MCINHLLLMDILCLSQPRIENPHRLYIMRAKRLRGSCQFGIKMGDQASWA